VTFGLRVNTLQGQLTFKTIRLEAKDDQTWVDPVAGLRLRTPADRLLQFRMYSEIGGFGAGSDVTWQLFPTLAINFTDSLSLDLGYRWLDVDYSTGEGNELFTYDVLTHGPVVGVGFRF
jgi:opacity protein-like surface antigen